LVDTVIAGIGPKIRYLRQRQGLSLQKLGERAGVSAAAIHKIERDGMVPTIATLMKIAVALNRPVAYFVEEAHESPAAVFTRAGEREEVFTSKQGLVLESISGSYGNFFVASAIATIEPGACSGDAPMEHPGEELVYLLQGRFHIEVDYERFLLSPGDALHFRTDRPHRWNNPGPEIARAVWIALRSR
jgi:transcriptional regulator with XRE-family HTH domain